MNKETTTRRASRDADGSVQGRDQRDSLRDQPPLPWHQKTWVMGMLGSAMWFASLPPLGWWMFAWAAPIPWLILTRRPQLAGRSPYLALYLAGTAYWFGMLHWMRLPHLVASIGWLALSMYLGIYLPIFMALVRTAVHRLGMSVVIAAPVVWTGLELAQAHVMTGFSLGLLGHSQYRQTMLIQISDLAGAYLVSFLVMLVAACLARTWPMPHLPRVRWPIAVLVLAIGGTLGYGGWQLSTPPTGQGPKVALIQGGVPMEIKARDGRDQEVYRAYYDLSRAAMIKDRTIDLLIWPETMCRETLYEMDADTVLPEDSPFTLEELKFAVADIKKWIGQQPKILGAPLLTGIDVVHYGRKTRAAANSAILVDDSGTIVEQYDKMHPVMFGEYIPFAKKIPWLYKLTPLTGGIEASDKPVSFKFGRYRLGPNICFESCVPHLIRRQVYELRENSEDPDLLVNLTNDSWFDDSSELDLHMICSVFRAVEMRKPIVIAANGGFSASISPHGEIMACSGRMTGEYLITQPTLDSRTSLYICLGDVFSGVCLAICGFISVVGVYFRFRRPVVPRPAFQN